MSNIIFTCPECDCHDLIVQVAHIHVGGTVYFDEEERPQHDNEDEIETRIEGYFCANCNFMIAGKDENPIIDDKGLVTWIKNHAPSDQLENEYAERRKKRIA